jgi:hypothetical protein
MKRKFKKRDTEVGQNKTKKYTSKTDTDTNDSPVLTQNINTNEPQIPKLSTDFNVQSLTLSLTPTPTQPPPAQPKIKAKSQNKVLKKGSAITVETILFNFNKLFEKIYEEYHEKQLSEYSTEKWYEYERKFDFTYLNNFVLFLDTIFGVYSLIMKHIQEFKEQFSNLQSFVFIYVPNNFIPNAIQNKTPVSTKIKYQMRFDARVFRYFNIEIKSMLCVRFNLLAITCDDENDAFDFNDHFEWLNKECNRIINYSPETKNKWLEKAPPFVLNPKTAKKRPDEQYFIETELEGVNPYTTDYLSALRKFQMKLTENQLSKVRSIVLKLLTQNINFDGYVYESVHEFKFDVKLSKKYNNVLILNYKSIGIHIFQNAYKMNKNKTFTKIAHEEESMNPRVVNVKNKCENLTSYFKFCEQEVGPILNLNSELIDYILSMKNYKSLLSETPKTSPSVAHVPEPYEDILADSELKNEIPIVNEYNNETDFERIMNYESEGLYREFIRKFANEWNLTII